MPLLLCPNDNASMATVQRSGVSFDMCPTCRGVWLDRGELEKLLESERASGAGGPQDDDRPRREDHRPDYRPPERYRDDDDHKYRGGYRKRSSIFDIFD
jgi:hypothetical protein